MQVPPTPPDEAGRLAALHALQLLDTAPEERFDRVTRTAQRLFDVPIVLVTLVDAERHWFKSCLGLDVEEIDREVSFCGHAVVQDEVFVVPDALHDERFADNPLVTGDPFIRFYAGYPVREPSGRPVGTLCIIDRVPRTLSADEEAVLRDLGSWVEHELASHQVGRAVEALRLSEAHLNAVLSSVADGVATFGIDGTVLSFNQAAEHMFRATAADVVGRPIWELVVDEDQHQIVGLLADRASEHLVDEVWVEVGARRADGTTFRMHVAASELRGSGGQVFIAVARDVTELSRLRRRNELILRSAGQGIIGVDTTGRVTFVNPAAASMLGVSDVVLIGSSLHETTHHTRPDGRPYPWDECPTYEVLTKRRSIHHEEEIYVRQDGSFFAVEYSAHPVVDSDGTFDGAVISFTDVTERREVERLKDQFVSVVSHELRTPLTSIRGALGLLSSGAIDLSSDKAVRMLEIATNNTERLARLVDDILVLERMRAGRAPVELVPVDAAGLLTTVAESLADVASTAGVDLFVEPQNVQVVADADRIIQVLTNLVGNAVKFSPAGGAVRLTVHREGSEVRLCVADEGRGIPPSQLEQIFLPFEQVDRLDALEKGGSGLGLAIARGIVEQHNGRIWAESEVGVGSTFVVALPAVDEEGS